MGAQTAAIVSFVLIFALARITEGPKNELAGLHRQETAQFKEVQALLQKHLPKNVKLPSFLVERLDDPVVLMESFGFLQVLLLALSFAGFFRFPALLLLVVLEIPIAASSFQSQKWVRVGLSFMFITLVFVRLILPKRSKPVASSHDTRKRANSFVRAADELKEVRTKIEEVFREASQRLGAHTKK